MTADEEPIASTLATTDYPYPSTPIIEDKITNTTEHGITHVCAYTCKELSIILIVYAVKLYK